MSGDRARRSAANAGASAEAQPSTNARNGAMLFKIVGPHQHRAVLGQRVFWCERESTVADGKLTVRWSAFEGKALLKCDCRTLNAAKNLCRRIAAGDRSRPYQAAISFAREPDREPAAAPPIGCPPVGRQSC